MNNFSRHAFMALMSVALLITITESCSEQKSSKELTVAEHPWVVSRMDTLTQNIPSSDSLEEKANELSDKLKLALATVEADGRKYYLVEGDLLMDGTELYYYCLTRIQNQDTNVIANSKSNELTVGVLRGNGRRAIWPPGTVIRYAVLKRSFDHTEHYEQVVAMLKQATGEWMAACNVKFEYYPTLDNIDPDESPKDPLVFVVREFNGQGKFLASSFFPGDPLFKRKLLIDPELYRSNVSRVGILRHELGHILGWRHEHIWSNAADCRGESVIARYLGARPVTQYDPYSVMHYLCGGVGSSELNLTDFDKIGAAGVYGPAPLP